MTNGDVHDALSQRVEDENGLTHIDLTAVERQQPGHRLDREPAPDARVDPKSPWARDGDSVCVFAPSISLSVTIESVDREPPWGEIHLHPAGQGFWIARLLAQLGFPALLCGPIGGESGSVIEALAPHWGVALRGVMTVSPNPSYVDDRRSGDRVHVARDQRSTLRRHEVDDLYGRVLQISLDTSVTVVTGRHPDDTMPLHVYERMGADLKSMGVSVIGDLHGPELDALLEHGRLEVLKVSHEDLIADGLIDDDSDGAIMGAIESLATRDIGWVVVSRANRGAMMGTKDQVHRVTQPELAVVDRRGSGDSMTAVLVAAWLRDLDSEEAVRLACAAGAANVTRRGLGSASAELIEQLANQVEIEPMERNR